MTVADPPEYETMALERVAEAPQVRGLDGRHRSSLREAVQ